MSDVGADHLTVVSPEDKCRRKFNYWFWKFPSGRFLISEAETKMTTLISLNVDGAKFTRMISKPRCLAMFHIPLWPIFYLPLKMTKKTAKLISPRPNSSATYMGQFNYSHMYVFLGNQVLMHPPPTNTHPHISPSALQPGLIPVVFVDI